METRTLAHTKKELERVKQADNAYLVNGTVPLEVLEHIRSYLPELSDYVSTTAACLHLHSLFQPPLQKAAQAPDLIVVQPNPVEIKKMLDANPELALKKFKKVTDNVGRTILDYSLFQLAYGAGDDAMCLLMKPYIERVCGGEEIRKQIKEKFEEEDKEKAEENEERIKEHLAKLLETVIQAISNESFNLREADNKLILSDDTLDAIRIFREAFDESQPKIITKGMLFRLNTPLEVCEAYADAAAQWGFDPIKCALFEDAVLSFVLRYVPANDVQRFNQGLYYLQNQSEPFERAKTTRDKYDFYQTLCGNSEDFFLDGSCVDIVNGLKAGKLSGRDAPLAMQGPLQNLYSEKISNLHHLSAATPTNENVSAHNLLT